MPQALTRITISSGDGSGSGIVCTQMVRMPSKTAACTDNSSQEPQGSLRARVDQEGLNLRPDWERVLCPTLGAGQACCSVRKAHRLCQRAPLSQRHRERSVERITGSRRIDDGDRKCRHMHPVIKCTHKGALRTKRE